MPKPAGQDSKRLAPASRGELARSVLKRQFRKIRDHEPGTRTGVDIEALHDMRVAVRRSRAALGLFRQSLPEGRRAHQAELRWLGRRLGPVRDLDVLIERIEKLAAAKPAMPPTATQSLIEAIENRRERDRAAMLAALDSERYQTWKSAYEVFLNMPFEDDDVPLAETLSILIEKRRNSFERAAKRLEESSPPEQRHRVRILAKRYRYALEFASEHLPPAMRRLPKTLATLQDALGALQDAAVAGLVLRSFAEQDPSLEATVVEIERRFGRLAERESAATFKLLNVLLEPPASPA